MSFKMVATIFLFLLLSCQFGTLHKESKKKVDCYSLQILKDFKVPQQVEDTVKFYTTWKQIVTMDTFLIDYLIELEHNKHWNICDSLMLGFEDTRNGINCTSMKFISNRLAALYFISALYYDNYYFASDRILYNCDKCLSIKQDSFAYKEFEFSVRCSHDENAMNTAWIFIHDWRKKIKGMDLSSIRRKRIHPFAGSSLYWVGEKGGLLDSTYNQKPIFN